MVLEFMGPTKILSFEVASLRIFDIRTVLKNGRGPF